MTNISKNKKKELASILFCIAFFLFFGGKQAYADTFSDHYFVKSDELSFSYAPIVNDWYEKQEEESILLFVCISGTSEYDNPDERPWATFSSYSFDYATYGGERVYNMEIDTARSDIAGTGSHLQKNAFYIGLVANHNAGDYQYAMYFKDSKPFVGICGVIELQNINNDTPPEQYNWLGKIESYNLDLEMTNNYDMETGNEFIGQPILSISMNGMFGITYTYHDLVATSTATQLDTDNNMSVVQFAMRQATSGSNSITWKGDNRYAQMVQVSLVLKDQTPNYLELFEGFNANYADIGIAESILCSVNSPCNAVIAYNEHAVDSIVYLASTTSCYPDYAISSTTLILNYDMESILSIPESSVATSTQYCVYSVFPDSSVATELFNVYYMETSTISWDYNIDEVCDDMISTTSIMGSIECAFRRFAYWSITPRPEALQKLNNSRQQLTTSFPFSVFNQVKDTIASTTQTGTTTQDVNIINPITGEDITLISKDDTHLGLLSPETWDLIFLSINYFLYSLGFIYFIFRIKNLGNNNTE